MPYKISVILDKTRLERIRGTSLEKLVKDLYGGYLKVIELEVPDDFAQRILKEFPRLGLMPGVSLRRRLWPLRGSSLRLLLS